MDAELEALHKNLYYRTKGERITSTYYSVLGNRGLLEESRKNLLINDEHLTARVQYFNVLNGCDREAERRKWLSSFSGSGNEYATFLMGYFPFILSEKNPEYKVGKNYINQNKDGDFEICWKTCTLDKIPYKWNHYTESYGMDEDYLLNSWNALKKHFHLDKIFNKKIKAFIYKSCKLLWLADSTHSSIEDIEEDLKEGEIELNSPLSGKRLPEYSIYKQFNEIDQAILNNREEYALSTTLNSNKITKEYIYCLCRKFNYRANKVIEALRPLSNYLQKRTDMLAGTLEEKSRVLYCDFDVYEQLGIDALKQFMDLFKIKPYFSEISATNGGVHAWFAFDFNLDNETRKAIEQKAILEGINVEITKFFSGNVTRLPMSYEYIPLKLREDFIYSGIAHLDNKKNFFKRFLEKGVELNSLSCLKKKLTEKTESSTNNYFNTKINEYGYLYVGNLHNLKNMKDKEENRSTPKKTGFELRDYKAGERFYQMGFEIPILRDLFKMSLDEACDSIMSRKGTSKDLNIWTKEKLKEEIRSYYNSAKLLDKYNKNSRAFLRIEDTEDAKQFHCNLPLIPEQYLDSLMQGSCYRRLGNQLYNKYCSVFAKKGKAFPSKTEDIYQTKLSLFHFLGTMLALEVAGKAIYESNIRIKYNRNKFIRNFQGVQFPDIYIDRFVTYICSLLNNNLAKSNLEKKIHFELNKILKPIAFKERYSFLSKFFNATMSYKLKRTVLEYFGLEKIKLANGHFSTKNHCINYKLTTLNEILGFLNSISFNCQGSLNHQLKIDENIDFTILERRGNSFFPLETNEVPLSSQEALQSPESISSISNLNQDKSLWLKNPDTGEVRVIDGLLVFNFRRTDLLYGIKKRIEESKEIEIRPYEMDLNEFKPERFHFTRAGPPKPLNIKCMDMDTEEL